MNNDWLDYQTPYLEHHGVRGQKWGIRRFQNKDGTLTAAGQKRYGEKVTMHMGGKTNVLLGGRKYQTHKEFQTANKFAKATWKQRRAEINEEKKNSTDGFVKKNVSAINKQIDNNRQYSYELARNRHNAGVHEFTRGTAIGAGKGAAKAAVKVGAGILAGYLAVNTANAVLNRANGGVSKSKNALATLNANKLDQHYEYSVGKKEVVKALAKATAVGALAGATKEISKEVQAQNEIRSTYIHEQRNGVTNTRAKRAAEDEKRWRKGQV